MQIICIGKLKSFEDARRTVVFFVSPCNDCIIEPAKSLTNEQNPLFRAFQYKEFLINYTAKHGDIEAAMEPFKIKLKAS